MSRNLEENFRQAVQNALTLNPRSETQRALKELSAPYNIKSAANMLATWIAAHRYGVGEAVDVVLIRATGPSPLSVSGVNGFATLVEFGYDISVARNDRDLRDSAPKLVQAVNLLGGEDATALLTGKVRIEIQHGNNSSLKRGQSPIPKSALETPPSLRTGKGSSTVESLQQGAGNLGEEAKRCPPEGPHVGPVVPKEHSRAQDIAAQNLLVEKSSTDLENSKKALEQAEKALEEKAGPRMSTLRQGVGNAKKALDKRVEYLAKQERKLKSLMWEEKVAEDCGGGRNIKLVCAVCGENMGDLDVVTSDGRVKEVKSSESGYSTKKEQFERYMALVEGKNVVGIGMRMKVAFPKGIAAEVERKHPELKGRVQGH